MQGHKKHYFFCGIGGSGMMPLAFILKSQGAAVSGSDRSYDNGHAVEKFELIKNAEINLYPQNGCGIPASEANILVVSGAIEESVPDVKTAKERDLTIKTRAEVLATMFNSYKRSISVAGTSGKSTVTGMIATILTKLNLDPTVMNGGMISNFTGIANSAAQNMRTGQSEYFVTETDESDGSIALYNPYISVVNNIALDHMPLSQLQKIFLDFVGRTKFKSIINADNPYCTDIIKAVNNDKIISFGLENGDLRPADVRYTPSHTEFKINGVNFKLQVAGQHNLYNALAAIAVALECGLSLGDIAEELKSFTGIKRRLQTIGTKNNITVIDDFGHNPDKIAATLAALKLSTGRLIIMFQPHGFAPLRLMGTGMVDSFARYLKDDDKLLMPEVYYAGGTVDRSVTSKDIIQQACERNLNAHWFENREHIKDYILSITRPNDRVVIMGARDDSLTDFAQSIVNGI